jgi:hypothetical protein
MPSVRNKFQMAALGALPQDSKNPFSLIQDKPSAWQGLVPGSTGFLKFTSNVYGVRAGFINLVNTYLDRGLDTIARIFPVYAPVGHGANDPQAYIASVERLSGIPRDMVIATPEQIYRIGKAIVQVEEGKFWVPQDEFDQGFNLAMKAKNREMIVAAGGMGLSAIVIGIGVWYFLIREPKKQAA